MSTTDEFIDNVYANPSGSTSSSISPSPSPSPSMQSNSTIADTSYTDFDDGRQELSDAQAIVLACLSILPALLSILGSALIVILVTRENKKSPYRRLMLALSICDIINSTAIIFDPLLLPSGSHPWALGNERTCSWSGFLAQIGTSSLWYSGALSFYFLATVRFGIRPEKYVFPYEWFCHTFIVLYCLSTSIHGLLIGLYGPKMGYSCWVENDYPEGCFRMHEYDDDEWDEILDENDDVVLCKTDTLSWIYGGFPILFIFLSVIVNNLVIYCYVRKTTMRSIRNANFRGSFTMSISDQTNVATATNDSNTIEDQNSNNNGGVGGNQMNGSNHNSTGNKNNRRHNNRQNSLWKLQRERLCAVRTQSLLYVAAFLLTYIWSFALSFVEGYTTTPADPLWYTVAALSSFFYPMQGFFNAFVFIRPRYLRHRQTHRNLSRYEVLKTTIFGGE